MHAIRHYERCQILDIDSFFKMVIGKYMNCIFSICITQMIIFISFQVINDQTFFHIHVHSFFDTLWKHLVPWPKWMVQIAVSIILEFQVMLNAIHSNNYIGSSISMLLKSRYHQ